jgi:hypothetical protein
MLLFVFLRGDTGYVIAVRITPVRSDGLKGSPVMAFTDNVVLKGCNFKIFFFIFWFLLKESQCLVQFLFQEHEKKGMILK